jgi:glycosyltransferase involved in cell wall biosynthesis
MYGMAATCCDWVVGICDATVNNLKILHTIPARKIVRIYNGVAPLRRVPPEKCPSKSGFTLLYVGRLAPVKNHTLLFKAFRLALLSRPDLRLWMVGDGSERKALEQLASELNILSQVTFWGQQMDVAPFFSAADVFIMSSMSEGLPMSVLQAFSLGIPAIVTDVGGMAEIVRLSQGGLSVPEADALNMSAAILTLSESDADRKQLSVNSEKAFYNRFMLERMVDAYSAVYQRNPQSNRYVS